MHVQARIRVATLPAMAVQVSLSAPDNHPRTELANGGTLAPLARQRPDVSPASQLFLTSIASASLSNNYFTSKVV